MTNGKREQYKNGPVTITLDIFDDALHDSRHQADCKVTSTRLVASDVQVKTVETTDPDLAKMIFCMLVAKEMGA